MKIRVVVRAEPLLESATLGRRRLIIDRDGPSSGSFGFIRADIDLYFVHRHAREVGQLQYSLIALANRSFLVRAAIGNLGGRRDIPRRDDSVLTIHRQGQYR